MCGEIHQQDLTVIEHDLVLSTPERITGGLTSDNYANCSVPDSGLQRLLPLIFSNTVQNTNTCIPRSNSKAQSLRSGSQDLTSLVTLHASRVLCLIPRNRLMVIYPAVPGSPFPRFPPSLADLVYMLTLRDSQETFIVETTTSLAKETK